MMNLLHFCHQEILCRIQEEKTKTKTQKGVVLLRLECANKVVLFWCVWVSRVVVMCVFIGIK